MELGGFSISLAVKDIENTLYVTVVEAENS